MIVVDVNTIAYLWIPGEMTNLAEKALARDGIWVSSILWKSEFRNILTQYLHKGDMGLETAQRCLDGAESQMSGREYILPSSLVMRKAAESRCSAYDCEYVALAYDMGIKLVTSDKQILSEFSEISISLKSFAHLEPDC
ncbi:type II toxin-antitoxin system VapC family toxin [Verrucomicrobiota bacterium]